MRHRPPNFFALLATFSVLAALITACETVPREVAKAQIARAQAFRETLDTYKPISSDENAVIALLKTYRDAYNASDLSRIDGLLASNFELRYYRPRSKQIYDIMIQNRAKYLEKRSSWSPKEPRGEKLIVRVLNVLRHPEGKGAVVVAATTYKSKYFHPRYIETYGFKRTSNGWLLRRLLVVPAQPKPGEVKVSLISLADISNYIELSNNLDSYRSFVDANGPDALFEKHIKLSCCIEDKQQPLVVVFPEPPADGSTITVVESAIGYSNTYTTTTTFHRNSQYTIFTGWGWYGSHLTVVIEVYVDGVLAGEGIL